MKRATPKKKPAPAPKFNRYNVEFLGKAWMRGVLTVDAKDEQEARMKAFADMREGGIVWQYIEEDEEYDAKIREVDFVCQVKATS
jgi:hypothetical protein